MAHDVFISYSSKDKTIADAVCATLEQNGIRCWIAPRDILAGMEYAQALVEAIQASKLLVLVFSSSANESLQVRQEVERAVSHGLPILPFRIEDVPPGGAMELFISGRHWLDALTPPLESHLMELAKTIRTLFRLPPNPVEPVKPPVDPISIQKPHPPGRNRSDLSPELIPPSPPPDVSSSLKWGVFVLALIMPIVGVIIGLIFVMDPLESKKAAGRLWLFTALGMGLLYAMMFLGGS